MTKWTNEYRREYQRKWMRKWRSKNPDRVKELSRLNRAKFGAQWLAKAKEFRKSNPEQTRAKDRQKYYKQRENRLRHMKAYRLRNLERVRLRYSIWCKNNVTKTRANNHKRRAIKKMATVADCGAKITQLSTEYFCHWCCARLTRGTYREKIGTSFTVDHVIPLSRGGMHSPENLAAACYSCNSSKGTKLVHEWTWREAA